MEVEGTALFYFPSFASWHLVFSSPLLSSREGREGLKHVRWGLPLASQMVAEIDGTGGSWDQNLIIAHADEVISGTNIKIQAEKWQVWGTHGS